MKLKALFIAVLATLMIVPAGFAQDGIGYLDSDELNLVPAGSTSPVASGNSYSGGSGGYSSGSSSGMNYYGAPYFYFGWGAPAHQGYQPWLLASYGNYGPFGGYNIGSPYLSGYGYGYNSYYNNYGYGQSYGYNDCYNPCGYGGSGGYGRYDYSPQPVYSQQAIESTIPNGYYVRSHTIAPSPSVREPGHVSRSASAGFNAQPVRVVHITPPSPKLAWYY